VLEQESEGDTEAAARLTLSGALMRGSTSAPAASSALTPGVFPSMAAEYSGERPSCDRGVERNHTSARATQRQRCANNWGHITYRFTTGTLQTRYMLKKIKQELNLKVTCLNDCFLITLSQIYS
jgi:hypothetical protein